jgi:hypothetical protein
VGSLLGFSHAGATAVKNQSMDRSTIYAVPFTVAQNQAYGNSVAINDGLQSHPGAQGGADDMDEEGYQSIF